MGRRKIEIAPILDDRSRSVTFLKRKNGLIKKAHELGVLCGAEVAVVIFASNGKLYQYSSGDLNATLQRHAAFRGPPSESRVPKDFVSCGKSKADMISDHGEIQADDDDAEDEDDSSSGKLELANSPMSEKAKPQAMKPGDFLFQADEPMPMWNYTGLSDSQVRTSFATYPERNPSAAPLTHLCHVTSSPLLGNVHYNTTPSANFNGAMALPPTGYNVFKHSDYNAAGDDAAGVSGSSTPAISFVSQHSHSTISDISSFVAEPCPPASAPLLNASAKTSSGFHLPLAIYHTNPAHQESGWSTGSKAAMMTMGVVPSPQLSGPSGVNRVQTPSSFPSNEYGVTPQSRPISRRDSISSSVGNVMNLRTGSAPRLDNLAGGQVGVGPIRRTDGLLSSSPYYRRTADSIDLFRPDSQASGLEIEPNSSPRSQPSESSTFPATHYIQSPGYDPMTIAQPTPVGASSRDDQNLPLYFQSNSRDFWDPCPITSVNDSSSTHSDRHDEWTVTETRH